ncbi:MAG: endonuclease VII domain-containing protein [Actinomycetota bacterium]
MSSKRCTKCGLVKPLSAFYAMQGMRDGHRNDCIECNKAAKRERHARDPEPYRERARQWALENSERRAAYQAEYRNRPERKRVMRDLYYRRTYGITADEVDEMLDAQNGGCAICGAKPERLASMHVDHDHDLGHLRGLLCIACNQGLGQFRDNPEILLRAIVYLRQRRSA